MPNLSRVFKEWATAGSGAAASYNRDAAGLAFDGDPRTFWTTASPTKGEIFGARPGPDRTVQPDCLRLASRPSSFPRHYAVETSLDGLAWTMIDYGRN